MGLTSGRAANGPGIMGERRWKYLQNSIRPRGTGRRADRAVAPPLADTLVVVVMRTIRYRLHTRKPPAGFRLCKTHSSARKTCCAHSSSIFLSPSESNDTKTSEPISYAEIVSPSNRGGRTRLWGFVFGDERSPRKRERSLLKKDVGATYDSLASLTIADYPTIAKRGLTLSQRHPLHRPARSATRS